MSDDPIRHEGESKPLDLKVPPKTFSFTEVQLNEPACGRNETLIEESEVPGSETWAADMKQILAHLPTVLSAQGLVELRIRAGKTWIVRRIVSLREVIFPDGEAEPAPKKG